MQDFKLTEHFWLSELTHSEQAVRRGISNDPTWEIVEELHKTAELLEKVRGILGGVPLLISSGYRSNQVNALVGGSSGSDHRWGGAADFTAPRYGTPIEICRRLAEALSAEEFGQLIYEGTWVHLSRVRKDRKWVGDIKTATFVNGEPKYLPGIVEK